MKQFQLLQRSDLPADIITVSPSQLGSWHKCQWAWKLAKVDKVEVVSDRPFGAANKGRIAHAFLDWKYSRSLGQGIGPLTEEEQQLALNEVGKLFTLDADFFKVWSMFVCYCEWAVRKEELVPVGTEIEVFAPTGLVARDGRPIYLHGILDMLAYLFEQLLVVDHKSHTNRAWDNERLLYEIQFKIYAVILELQGVEIDGVCVNTLDLWLPKNPNDFHPNFIKGKKGPRPRFQRFMLSKRDLRLQFVLDQVLKTIKKMWVDDPDYEMRLDEQCKYCRYKEHIDYDSRGAHNEAVVALRDRFAVDDSYSLEVDLGEDD